MKLKNKIRSKQIVYIFKYWRDFNEENAEQLLQKINKILSKIKSL